MLATPPGGTTTDLIFQPLDSATVAPAVAHLTHLPGTAVLGAVVPSTNTVLVIAGTEQRRDPAFGSSLLLMGEGQETKLVSTQVYRGTRPLVLDDGRAFVQRGVEGSEPTDEDIAAGRLRVDHLTIEQIDLGGGASKVLSSFDGYIAFIAGALRHEIFVYRVGPDGADIIGVDADSGRERTVQRPLPPYARDFSVDAQGEALLYTNADVDHPGTWVAERLSVAQPTAAIVPPSSRAPVAGLRTRLATASHPGLAPTAWTQRAIATNRDFAGLQLMAAPGKVPFERGVDIVREFFVQGNATFALGVHHAPDQLPEPFIVQTSTMDVQKIAVPTTSRIDVAGMLPAPSVSKPAIQQLEMPSARPVRLAPQMFKRFVAPQLEEER
jgi:hypothetical protein